MSTQVRCDFCYAPHTEWTAKMECQPRPWLAWEFAICDSCRLLLRNVLGPVLHRLSHTDVVGAIMQAMNQRGITYEDLMKPLLELNAIQAQTETVVDTDGRTVATFESSAGTD